MKDKITLSSPEIMLFILKGYTILISSWTGTIPANLPCKIIKKYWMV